MNPSPAWRSGLFSALRLLAFVLLTTAILAAIEQATRARIAASAAQAATESVRAILTSLAYDNDLMADKISLPPLPLIGNPTATPLYLAKHQGQLLAVVVEASALDGYAGEIRMLYALAPPDNAHRARHWQIIAARVLKHKETPGLGDYIDPAKDRNKVSPWINQLRQRDRASTPSEQWHVKKDGGQFDSRTGATITARAVIQLSERVLAVFDEQGASLLARR